MGQLRIKSVSFEGPEERHEGSFGIIYWQVEAAARFHGGPAWDYSLTFEPFDGKLTGLWRNDEATRADHKK